MTRRDAPVCAIVKFILSITRVEQQVKVEHRVTHGRKRRPRQGRTSGDKRVAAAASGCRAEKEVRTTLMILWSVNLG